MISASALERVSACPVSEVYPHRGEVARDYCTRGIAIHAFLEDCLTVGRDEALERVDDEHRDACELIEVEKLPASEPGSYAAEVAFALDVGTGYAREIGRAIGRNYGELGREEIPGTADVVGLASDGETVVVFDYKSGWSDVPKADVNKQMRYLALAAARTYGRKRAHVAIIRVRSDGGVWYDRAALDEFDLANVWFELQADLDAVRAATVETPPVIGDHCRYCPAFASCRANTAMAVAMAHAPTVDQIVGALTPETAAEAWRRLKVAKAVIEEADKAVRTFAAQYEGGIDLGNGKVLAEVQQGRDGIDGGKALYLLRSEFGDDLANSVCSITTSKKAIEDAVGNVAKAAKKPMAPARRDIIQKLRDCGAIKRSRKATVTEVKAERVEAK